MSVDGWPELIKVLVEIGLPGIGVLAVVGVLSGLLVPYLTVRDLQKQRDAWMSVANKATDNSRNIVEAAKVGVEETGA